MSHLDGMVCLDISLCGMIWYDKIQLDIVSCGIVSHGTISNWSMWFCAYYEAYSMVLYKRLGLIWGEINIIRLMRAPFPFLFYKMVAN
jgi:hypothetical protein